MPGIDLGLGRAGEIAGKEAAEAAQLMIEYDPQPPFDSGHMNKASSAVRRKVTAMVGREGADLLIADPRTVVREVSAIAKLSWTTAIDRVRARRRPGKR